MWYSSSVSRRGMMYHQVRCFIWKVDISVACSSFYLLPSHSLFSFMRIYADKYLSLADTYGVCDAAFEFKLKETRQIRYRQKERVAVESFVLNVHKHCANHGWLWFYDMLDFFLILCFNRLHLKFSRITMTVFDLSFFHFDSMLSSAFQGNTNIGTNKVSSSIKHKIGDLMFCLVGHDEYRSFDLGGL